MKTINFLAAGFVAALLLSSAPANGEDRPALMIDANQSSSQVIFSQAGSATVSGIQFDLAVHSSADSMAKDKLLSNCVSGLPSTHRGSCSVIGENTVRVLIFSLENSPLPASTLGSFPANVVLIEESVVAGTAEAKKVNVDILNIPGTVDQNGESHRPVIRNGKVIQ